MSKKSLLNESTVRRFMKYANIGHLSENFIGEGDGFEEEEEELDLGAEEGPAPDMGDEAPEAPEGDMGAEIEMSPEDALALVQGLASEISDLTGHEVTASADEGGEEAPMDDMGDEAPMDDLGDMDGEEAPVEDEEGVLEGVDMIDEEGVVNETLRRVTRRIKGMQKRDRLAETVTNRIMKRLHKNK